jgi:hypothetical protein
MVTCFPPLQPARRLHARCAADAQRACSGCAADAQRVRSGCAADAGVKTTLFRLVLKANALFVPFVQARDQLGKLVLVMEKKV